MRYALMVLFTAWFVGMMNGAPALGAGETETRCLVYATDFSSNPNWTTDQPANYFWDSAARVFSARTVNAGVWPSRFAYTTVDFGGGSLELEFEVNLRSLGSTAALSFGLFNSDRSIDITERPTARGIFVKFGGWDQRKHVDLAAIGGNGIHQADMRWDVINENTWYQVNLEYQSSDDRATCRVRRRDNGITVANLQLTNIGGLPANLDFLGFARDPIGSCCPTNNNCNGFICSASATGIFDEVELRVSCAGEPPPPPPPPPPPGQVTLRLSNSQSSTCSPGSVKVRLTNPDPVTGLSFGVSHDPAALRATDIRWTGVAAAVNGGQGPEFSAISLTPLTADCSDVAAGVTAAMVVTTSGDPRTKAIPAGTNQEIATIEYTALASPAVATALEFRDCLRPKLDTEITPCVAVVNGNAVIPLKEGVTVTADADSKCFFMRGDCNDDGAFNISDSVSLLIFLFGQNQLIPCTEACNASDDGSIDLSDAIRMLSRLFLGGDPLPPPFQTCGSDPTTPSLGCTTYSHC